MQYLNEPSSQIYFILFFDLLAVSKVVTKLRSTNGAFISTQILPQYFKQLHTDNIEWTALVFFSAVIYYTLSTGSEEIKVKVKLSHYRPGVAQKVG